MIHATVNRSYIHLWYKSLFNSGLFHHGSRTSLTASKQMQLSQKVDYLVLNYWFSLHMKWILISTGRPYIYILLSYTSRSKKLECQFLVLNLPPPPLGQKQTIMVTLLFEYYTTTRTLKIFT
jgi:hypothetical protein